MDKYSEMHRAVVEAQNMLIRPQHAIKSLNVPSYTSDLILCKRESLQFPKEVQKVIQEGGRMDLVDGLSLLWASSRGRLVLWELASLLVHEVETYTTAILSVYPIPPPSNVFVQSVQACLLLFTEKEVSFLCYCSSPDAYISPGISASLPVQMSAVCTGEKGRVFLGGVDGNLYELEYSKPGWFGGKSARIICHTSGLLSFFLPFVFSTGKRPAVSQIVSTRRGLLVLYTDNALEAFEVESSLRKVRAADLASLKIQKEDRLQLISVDGGGYEAYLVLSDGTRVFLDNYGSFVGQRSLPSSRMHRLARAAPLSPAKETFFSIGKYLVVLGYRDHEGAVSVVSPNKKEQSGPENCCTVFINGPGYLSAALAPLDPAKRSLVTHSVEHMLCGVDVALLSRERVDMYHIIDGVDVIERSNLAPEGLFSFRQRYGAEYTLLISLYAVSLGICVPAIQSLFRKSPSLHKKCISAIGGILLQSVWDVDLADIVTDSALGGTIAYTERLKEAVMRVARLRTFLRKEPLSYNELIIEKSSYTVIDMFDDALEAMQYMQILLKTDLKQVLDTATSRASHNLKVTLGTVMNPGSSERMLTLDSLIDMHIGNSSSIDAISATLNEKCPSIFALSDTLLLKGKDVLTHALHAKTPEDREWYLEKSLSFFLKTPHEHMPFIVDAYTNARYGRGVLCMLQAGFSSTSTNDITKCFQKLEYKEELLNEALKDERSAFVFAILDSVLKKVQDGSLSPDELLKIKSTHLEEYLDKIESTEETKNIRDLAWKYHIKHGNYYAAMLYLIKAAEDRRHYLTIQERVEYLAIACTMQSTAGTNKYLPAGKIREYVPKSSLSVKERLKMSQKQTEVMSSLIMFYKNETSQEAEDVQLAEVFKKLEKDLLGYEELFEICVAFGFSLIALSISNAGVIEDLALCKALWEDALTGDYSHAISILKKNRDLSSCAPLDVLLEILLKKRLESTPEALQDQRENLGNALLFLGFPPIAIARVLESKATSAEYSSPDKKRVILSDAVEFCRICALSDIYHRLSSIQQSLGLVG